MYEAVFFVQNKKWVKMCNNIQIIVSLVMTDITVTEVWPYRNKSFALSIHLMSYS